MTLRKCFYVPVCLRHNILTQNKTLSSFTNSLLCLAFRSTAPSGNSTIMNPKTPSGMAASTSDSTAEQLSDWSSERNADHNSEELEQLQINEGQRVSATENDATDDGADEVERQDPPGVEQAETSVKSARRTGGIGATQSTQLAEFSHPAFRELARINGIINFMTRGQLRMQLAEFSLCIGGVKEVLRKRLKNYYRWMILAASNITRGVELVPYDFFVVVDFETTFEINDKHFVHEIIEFPGVLIEVQNMKIIAMFREFCKPVLNPVLTEICKNLTGVNQSEVNNASEFPGVLESFHKWLDIWDIGTQRTLCVVTDAPWDFQIILRKQCEISQVPMPQWSLQWLNIRKTFANFYNTGRLCLNSMLDNLGMVFEGRPHCGLHDANNIARVVCQMIEDGSALKANEELGRVLPDTPHGGVDPEDGTPSGDDTPPPQNTESAEVACASTSAAGQSTQGPQAAGIEARGCEE